MRAPAAIALLQQASAAWPTRKKASDGVCGDAAHQQRNSAHNVGAAGYCHAVDLTQDPPSGCDCAKVYDSLRKACKAGAERRATVLIHARKYASRRTLWFSVPYLGIHPHNSHIHVSIEDTQAACEDTSPWPLGVVMDWIVPCVGITFEARERLLAYCDANYLDAQANGSLVTVRVRTSKLDALMAWVKADGELAMNSPSIYDVETGHTSVVDWKAPYPQVCDCPEQFDWRTALHEPIAEIQRLLRTCADALERLLD